jgi:hypothetical protein
MNKPRPNENIAKNSTGIGTNKNVQVIGTFTISMTIIKGTRDKVMFTSAVPIADTANTDLGI